MTTNACRWDQDCTGSWVTDCGYEFVFNDGTPRDNHARFCMYCGKPLRFTSYRDPSHRASGHKFHHVQPEPSK